MLEISVVVELLNLAAHEPEMQVGVIARQVAYAKAEGNMTRLSLILCQCIQIDLRALTLSLVIQICNGRS